MRHVASLRLHRTGTAKKKNMMVHYDNEKKKQKCRDEADCDVDSCDGYDVMPMMDNDANEDDGECADGG